MKLESQALTVHLLTRLNLTVEPKGRTKGLALVPRTQSCGFRQTAATSQEKKAEENVERNIC